MLALVSHLPGVAHLLETIREDCHHMSSHGENVLPGKGLRDLFVWTAGPAGMLV